MKPHEQRVIDEKAQLDDRMEKLVAFLGSETFTQVDTYNQLLLQMQAHAMTTLSGILNLRISQFEASHE